LQEIIDDLRYPIVISVDLPIGRILRNILYGKVEILFDELRMEIELGLSVENA